MSFRTFSNVLSLFGQAFYTIFLFSTVFPRLPFIYLFSKKDFFNFFAVRGHGFYTFSDLVFFLFLNTCFTPLSPFLTVFQPSFFTLSPLWTRILHFSQLLISIWTFWTALRLRFWHLASSGSKQTCSVSILTCVSFTVVNIIFGFQHQFRGPNYGIQTRDFNTTLAAFFPFFHTDFRLFFRVFQPSVIGLDRKASGLL